MQKKFPIKTAAAVIIIFAAALGLLFLRWRHMTPIQKHPGAVCVLTQHFDATGAQCMFYTLETKKGLVVIDGGSSANSEYVRSVIKAKGGHVFAWIITHGHPDHVGAFNVIYPDPQDIIIDSIYSTDFDIETYHRLCNWWDEPEYYDEFWRLTHCGSTDGSADKNFHTLKAGDSIDMCGMTVDVFSSFSETGEDYGDDIANLGSLMFKVTAGKSTVLFCSDIHDNRGLYSDLADTWGEALSADYLQMGHHGNNSCTHEFIELVNPDHAFMDCPEGFFDDPGYDAADNRDYLAKQGIKIYHFGSAPNEIVLK